jgi:type I restriction enzyme R subunit
VIGKTVAVYDANGKLLRQESIIDYTKSNIHGFMLPWTILSVNGLPKRKKREPEMLLERGIDFESMKTDQNMADVMIFDFICHVAFDQKPYETRTCQ